MSRRTALIFSSSIVVLLGLLVTVVPVTEAQPPIRIGAALVQTGVYAALGQNQLRGYQLCVKHMNEKGGVLGRKLELVLYDDASDPATAVRLYEKVITQDKVDLVLGPYGSPITDAVANVTEKYKMPTVAIIRQMKALNINPKMVGLTVGVDTLRFYEVMGRGDARHAQHRGHGKQPATDGVGRQPHAFERVCAQERAAFGLAENHERDHGSFGDPDPRLSDVKLDMPAIGEHEHVSGVTHDTKPHEKRSGNHGVSRPGVDQRLDRLEALSRRIADVDGDLECAHALTVHLRPSG